MTKYYLIQNGKEIENAIDFNKIEGFNNLDSYKLKDIVTFTSTFYNEEDLKFFLVKNNLIELKNMGKELKIVYRHNKKQKTLMYGITYKNDYEFFDVNVIKRFLYENQKNYDLLEKLCNHYKNAYNQEINLHIIKSYVIFSRNEGIDYDVTNSEKEQMIKTYQDAINRFVDKTVTKFDSKKLEVVENYKGLRDLAMFLSYQYKKQQNDYELIKMYDMELEKIIEEHNNEHEEFLTYEDYDRVKYNEPEENKKNNKVKIKEKNINIPGQLTFKDMGW